MNVPRPFFYIGETLCIRLPEGGWRKATPEEAQQCRAQAERERQQLAARTVPMVTK